MTVSYCVTLYNKAPYIERVIDALLAEHATTGGEIVVYDDASTDGSAELVSSKPVRLIRGTPNAGVFAATERLIREAVYPYLRLVDGDDRIVAGSTARLIDGLTEYSVDLAHGRIFAEADATGSITVAPFRMTDQPFRRLLKNMSYNLSASLLRTDAAKALLPLPQGFTVSQDLSIALRIARTGAIASTEAMTAVAPDEVELRLSRRLAAMYRAVCLIIEKELELRGSRADAAYAVRRNARRCLRYFAREAPGSLRAAERLGLALEALSPPVRSVAASRQALRWIAALYERDQARILRHPA